MRYGRRGRSRGRGRFHRGRRGMRRGSSRRRGSRLLRVGYRM